MHSRTLFKCPEHLTLAADEGTTQLLAVMKNDPDKAEQLMGQAFQQRMQEIFGG